MPQPLVPQEGWCSWNGVSDAVSLFNVSVRAASFLPDCCSVSELCQCDRKNKLLIVMVSSLSGEFFMLAKTVFDIKL